MLKWDFHPGWLVPRMAGLFVVAGVVLAGLWAPLAAQADTITGNSFALPTSGTTASISSTFTPYIGGLSTQVDCNALSTMNAWVPTAADLQARVQVPGGAVWEYWQAEEVANAQETTITPYGDPYVSGGTHVAWGYLFARNLSTGAAFYRNGTAWISTTGYQPFFHPGGGNSYAIHDWIYYGMSDGTTTQWTDLGFRNSGAYQGPEHIILQPHCYYP